MLTFVTSNQNKADIAKLFLAPLGISFSIKPLELEEIQSDDFSLIAEKKAEHAYSLIKQPLFITDHSWTITALNGFPGPYMKYINKWLTADDLLRLMEGKENREVFLNDVLCYIDKDGTKIFLNKSRGEVLLEKQGKGLPAQEIISLTDDMISIAQKLETTPSARRSHPVYEEFGRWFKENGKILNS